MNEGHRGGESIDRRLPAGLPSRLGSYEIQSLLGKGGMGVVCKARHLLLNQTVAIKVLHLNLPQADRFVTRFHREMAAFGQLGSHPNLVRAFYAGEEAGLFYLVMEYVEGQTIERVVRRRGALPEQAACEVVRQVALGLDALAEAGLVHRDIKPANLMLAADGLIKILDMGLVRLREPEGDMPELTGTGALLGTLNYLAPEQAVDPRTVDIRADIYSLGCTLYQLLTGRPPYQEYASSASKIHAHAYVPFPAVDRVIDPALARMLARMTRKDPAERPSTPREVAEVMGRLAPAVTLSTFLEGPAAGDGGSARDETLTADSPTRRTCSPAPLPEPGSSVGLPSPRPGTAGPRPAPGRVFRRATFAILAIALGSFLVYGIHSAIRPPSGEPTGPGMRPDPVDSILAAGGEAPTLDELPPYEPHDLLARAPVQAVWERGDGTAFRTYEAARKQLIVTSPRNSLFHLGKLEAGSFTLQVRIKQPRWAGGPGVYLGFRPDEKDPSAREFQYLRFGEVTTPEGKRIYTLARGRCLLRTLANRKAFQWADKESVDLARPPEDAWLIVEVARHRIHRIRLDGLELETLAAPAANGYFTPADHRGCVGLLNSTSSCVFHQASLTLKPER